MRGRPSLLLPTRRRPAALLPGPSRRWSWCRWRAPRNAHYAIHAMIPWSVWSALGLANLGGRLAVRGWSTARLRRLAVAGFAGLAAACGLGFWLAGPWLDRRGVEWAFYEAAGRRLAARRAPRPALRRLGPRPVPHPLRAIPHDLAVRLYYLKRPACWHFDAASLRSAGVGPCLHTDAARRPALVGDPRPRARPPCARGHGTRRGHRPEPGRPLGPNLSACPGPAGPGAAPDGPPPSYDHE